MYRAVESGLVQRHDRRVRAALPGRRSKRASRPSSASTPTRSTRTRARAGRSRRSPTRRTMRAHLDALQGVEGGALGRRRSRRRSTRSPAPRRIRRHNVFEQVVAAAEAGCTHGEICGRLRRELGLRARAGARLRRRANGQFETARAHGLSVAARPRRPHERPVLHRAVRRGELAAASPTSASPPRSCASNHRGMAALEQHTYYKRELLGGRPHPHRLRAGRGQGEGRALHPPHVRRRNRRGGRVDHAHRRTRRYRCAAGRARSPTRSPRGSRRHAR